MRVLLAVLPLVLVACGPSEAEKAFASCQSHMNARNWRAAETACKLAADLEPSNRLYQGAYLDAILEARMPMPSAEDLRADAEARQADALEDAAFTAQRAELRRRLESH